jgi:hypothetical protein
MTRSWTPFFAAQVGASAALAGLVFVALSINLSRIMEHAELVDRAGEAVVLLAQPVVSGLAILAPYRSIRTTGWLVLPIVIGTWLLVTRLAVRAQRGTFDLPRWQPIVRITLAEIALLPAVIGAVLLVSGSSAGFGLVALGAVVCIGVGILDAWVLLVEILR